MGNNKSQKNLANFTSGTKTHDGFLWGIGAREYVPVVSSCTLQEDHANCP
jgi:hypothetical protein